MNSIYIIQLKNSVNEISFGQQWTWCSINLLMASQAIFVSSIKSLIR